MIKHKMKAILISLTCLSTSTTVFAGWDDVPISTVWEINNELKSSYILCGHPEDFILSGKTPTEIGPGKAGYFKETAEYSPRIQCMVYGKTDTTVSFEIIGSHSIPKKDFYNCKGAYVQKGKSGKGISKGYDLIADFRNYACSYVESDQTILSRSISLNYTGN